MKDEIKEINITFPGQILDYVDTKEHLLELFYHITNLQQKLEYYENIDPDKTIDKFRQKINKEMFNLQEENKELKHRLEQMYNNTKDTYNEICAEQIDYKSRNEKAIEEIDNWKNCLETGLRKNSKKICISTAKNMLFFIKLKLTEGENND